MWLDIQTEFLYISITVPVNLFCAAVRWIALCISTVGFHSLHF